ncbi:MAG: hypothetical protein MJ068_03260 [Clostridia bacterium]|nr:hypothetical protein [Clostridia bacterium]
MDNGGSKTITIDDMDIEVIKSAFNYYIRDIEFQISKIENSDFYNFEKLSDCQHRIITLKQKIDDNEKIISSKEPDNPRQLRDEIAEREDKIAQAKTELVLLKTELSKVEEENSALTKVLKDNSAEVENLRLKITAAQKLIQKKLDGNEISQKGN